VRVVAATNRQPEEAVADGKLREDLLYRLQVFPIHLPPLRERGDDLGLLADHFLNELNAAEGTNKKFTPAAHARMRAHSWPGNVRELKNVIHRAFILADEEIGADNLPSEVLGAPNRADDASGPSLHLRVGTSIAEADRRLILATLEECGADKKKAAEILGISLKTLYNRLNSYKSVGPRRAPSRSHRRSIVASASEISSGFRRNVRPRRSAGDRRCSSAENATVGIAASRESFI
jgi:DNA-binding NtrC family response regulator